MLNIVFEQEYKKSPSLLWDLGVLIFWLNFLSGLIFVIATNWFTTELDMSLFSKNTAPIYSLFGTICLAYEFLTALRNESNRNRLNQQIIKTMGLRDAASQSIINATDRKKRIDELNSEIENYEGDLKHEMQYVRRKYIIAWFGMFLVVISTFLQLFAA